MNTLIGIAIALFSYLPASQLWEVYKREKLLSSLMQDTRRLIDCLESDNFMNEESGMERQLNKISEAVPYKLKLEILEKTDKSATRRTLIIWMILWVLLLYIIFQIGFVFFVFAIVLAILGGAKKLSKPGVVSALLHFRMLLKTFIDWKNNDEVGLDSWLRENTGFEEMKYEAMVQMVRLSKR